MAAATGFSDEEILKFCHEPDPSTKDFFFQQTMMRIKDPRKSVEFYTKVLGMTLLAKLDFPEMSFSLYFMGYCSDRSKMPSDKGERRLWALQQPGTIELTHNYGTESDPDQHYHTGNTDPKGYGHIGIAVPDVYAASERFEKLGVEFVKKPDGGKMKGLAFIKDPDGYWIEIFKPSKV